MSEAPPRHIRDVQQAIHAIQIDERAEVGDVFHGAGYAVADIDAFHEFLALITALLLDHFAPAEHDVLAIVVELDDFEIVCVANELLQILWRNDIDLRSRQERLHADVDHQAAFDHRLYLAFDQSDTFENTDDFVPILAIGGYLFRENDHAFFVFQSLQENVHLVADFQRFDIFKFG